MKLERLANTGVVVLSVDDTLNAAIQQMWKLNIRHLPVLRQATPVGMVSERDVLFHVCWADHHRGEDASLRETPLSGASRIDQMMTSPVISLSPEDPVDKAARLMLNKRISSVALAAGESIVGIVTETDLLRCFCDEESLALSDAVKHSTVGDRMTCHVFSVAPDDPTLAAIRLMRDKQVRHVPVVRNGDLVGIISDRDVLRGGRRVDGMQAISVQELHGEDHSKVDGIMSTTVETLAPNATLAEAAKKFVGKKIGALPVLDEGKLVGIITETDLLRAFLADCETHVEN